MRSSGPDRPGEPCQRGGWGEAAGELLLEPAREVMLREALPPGDELVRVVPATLGSEAGVVGAGFVAFEALDAA